MIELIKPQIRKVSELLFHSDAAPGKRYVFVDKSLYPKSEFYIIGRRVESVPKNQPEYVQEHRHNCNSFYFFIGDNKDLSGLEAKVNIEGKEFIAESPSTVMIPESILHHYKLANGKGWFFHTVLKPNYNESITDKLINQIPEISEIYKKFEKQIKAPKDTERPCISGIKELKNPQRWILVKPEIFPEAGIYAALHQIFSDIPFNLNQRLHDNPEDEVYLFFARNKEYIEAHIYSSERKKKKIKSPMTAYYPKETKHKYDYVNGQGFLLIVLKERFPGAGYEFRI